MRWPGKTGKKRGIPISSLRIERDVHTHLIPGVDDGEFTFGTAAQALSLMRDKGVLRVCLTPHVMAGVYDNHEHDLTEGMKGIVRCAGNDIPELHLGAEYMIDQNLLSLVRHGTRDLLTIKDGRVLVEMSCYGISAQLFDVAGELTGAGFTPVLAHPERYLYMAGQMERFDMLHEAGCEFQLNLLSTTGAYGELSMRIMGYLLERSYYRYVGSDIHSPRQLDAILASQMDEKTAAAGEAASLWSFNR